jgi:phosphocarrier protein
MTEPVMARAEVEIVNKLGLHARASAKLTQIASGFKCEVWLQRNGRRVNAKSIMGVMMLAAGKGSSIVIEAEGEDAEAAIAALAKLIADRFDEGE